MENKTNDSAKTTEVARTLAEFVLGQIKTRKPTGLEEITLWNSDCLRLENGIKGTYQNKTDDYATDLTNLATGMLTIYRNNPYKKE